MKIKNTKLSILKNGKSVGTIRNRFVNNGLDWCMAKNLNSDLIASVYPKFSSYVNNIRDDPFSYTYLKFGTIEDLDDTSTEMAIDQYLYNNEDFEYNETSRVLIYADPIDNAYAGQILSRIGFGIQTSSTSVNNFLISYVDVDFLGITFDEGDTIRIIREDKVSTEFEVSTYTSTWGIPWGLQHIYAFRGYLESITFKNKDNGQGITYPIGNLTISPSTSGQISITGFGDFKYSDDGLFPSEDLYPSESLYPEAYAKYNQMVIKYTKQSSSWIGNLTETIDLNKANISNNGGTITVTYGYERG